MLRWTHHICKRTLFAFFLEKFKPTAMSSSTLVVSIPSSKVAYIGYHDSYSARETQHLAFFPDCTTDVCQFQDPDNRDASALFWATELSSWPPISFEARAEAETGAIKIEDVEGLCFPFINLHFGPIPLFSRFIFFVTARPASAEPLRLWTGTRRYFISYDVSHPRMRPIQ